MKTVYAATYVEKLVAIDHEETGCETKTQCAMSDRINTTAESLLELVEKLKSEYCHDGNYLFLANQGWIEWNQHEDINCNPLTHDGCKKLWSEGKQVYLCDYSFKIEKRTVETVSENEIRALEGYVFD